MDVKYTLTVHPRVDEDLHEAFLWYVKKSQRTAARLITSYQAALDRIEDNPLQFAKLKSIYRHCRIIYFPYHIIFALEDRLILVMAVTHEARDPVNVLRTLREREN